MEPNHHNPQDENHFSQFTEVHDKYLFVQHDYAPGTVVCYSTTLLYSHV